MNQRGFKKNERNYQCGFKKIYLFLLSGGLKKYFFRVLDNVDFLKNYIAKN